MEALPYIIIFLSIGMYWKRQHQKFAHEKFRNNVSEIKDRLVILALDGKVDPNSFAFKYHILSIEKTLEKSYFLTFPFVFLSKFFHRDDAEGLNEFRMKVEESTAKNLDLVRIQSDLIKALFLYMKDQHFVSLLLVKGIFKAFGKAKKMKNEYNKIISAALFLPETSASDRYTMNQALC
ncbi:hypothetical protein [Dyadobacter sp. CY323]|uniref:hypothetical protein n=1 Tax=Dyadobacter sp. CY323 TaxID=2907302 RepID=UPI001F2CB69A|nr:hypothetical protein [Dyadobacter sp. CY323]MCE6992116.1 hypothetical protein [Dyadobacter sp. CY323]